MYNVRNVTAAITTGVARELSDLSLEQLFKAQECKTPQELLALASEEGIELSDEDLAKVSGGYSWYEEGNAATNPIPAACKHCGSTNTRISSSYPRVGDVAFWYCNSCHRNFYAVVDQD